MLMTNIICCVLNTILGFIIIRDLTNNSCKLFNINNLIQISILVILSVLLYSVRYNPIYTLSVYVFSIIIYKYIFDEDLFNIIILVSIFFLLMLMSDIIVSCLSMYFINIKSVRGVWYLKLFGNIAVVVLTFLVYNIHAVKIYFKSYISKLDNNKKTSTIIFFLLLMIICVYMLYNISVVHGFDSNYLVDLIVLSAFFFLVIIFINEKNNYYKLESEYENLFNFAQEFEERIENEEYKNHEYKNQLAILIGLSDDKEVIDAIHSFIEKNKFVEEEWIKGLRYLPKSILKGLIFYKFSIAKKNNINIAIDVSHKAISLVEKLNDQQLQVLCSLLNIYFDKAIDNATKTEDKNILLEIYIKKGKLNITITSSILENMKIDKIYIRKKGFKLLEQILYRNYEWINIGQKIIDDNYYVQEIEIKN